MGVMTHSNDSAQGFTKLEMGFGTHFQFLDYHTSLEVGLMTHFKLAYNFYYFNMVLEPHIILNLFLKNQILLHLAMGLGPILKWSSIGDIGK